MTNDEFILGLIDIGVQKGYPIPDKSTGTKYLDEGKFTFLYGGQIVKLQRDNRGMGIVPKNKKFFFVLCGMRYYISEETYNKADEYFYDFSDYEKLKIKLEKDLRKTKLEKIENE